MRYTLKKTASLFMVLVLFLMSQFLKNIMNGRTASPAYLMMERPSLAGMP
jgi:hypothetical protein